LLSYVGRRNSVEDRQRRNSEGGQVMKYGSQRILAAGAAIGLLGAMLAPGAAQSQFPLAAPAGVDSKASEFSLPRNNDILSANTRSRDGSTIRSIHGAARWYSSSSNTPTVASIWLSFRSPTDRSPRSPRGWRTNRPRSIKSVFSPFFLSMCCALYALRLMRF